MPRSNIYRQAINLYYYLYVVLKSVSGSGGVTLWGIYLSFVGGNVQEDGGGELGFPKTVGGLEGQATEGKELEKRGSGEGNQRSGNSDTGEIH